MAYSDLELDKKKKRIKQFKKIDEDEEANKSLLNVKSDH